MSCAVHPVPPRSLTGAGVGTVEVNEAAAAAALCGSCISLGRKKEKYEVIAVRTKSM